MDMTKLKGKEDWFKVIGLKSIDDPSGRVSRKEMVVSLDQYPHDLSLGPNPREPVLSSPVSKKIERTLKESPDRFHLLNRGVTLVAKGMEYDNSSSRVRLRFAEGEGEQRFFGILDGGNTNARINRWRKELGDGDFAELSKRCLNIQVLIPRLEGRPPTEEMTDLLNDIKEARNTSVQVKSKSLADARRQFNTLQTVLFNEPYFNRIAWHEGQKGNIDALQLITLLMLFYPPFSYDADGNQPANAYGHKERCLDAYLEYSQSQPEQLDRWIRILPDLILLYDSIQLTFPEFYQGHFGRIKEVRIWDEKKHEPGSKKYSKNPQPTTFLEYPMKYTYPMGWTLPIFSSLRALAYEDKSGGIIAWKRDPLQFWKTYGRELCARYEPHMRENGYEVKKIATSVLCYQAMWQSVVEFYKNDLLQEHGISA